MTKKKTVKELPIELPHVEELSQEDADSLLFLRHNAAIAILQGILANPHVTPAAMQHKGPELAVKMADALLAELSKP